GPPSPRSPGTSGDRAHPGCGPEPAAEHPDGQPCGHDHGERLGGEDEPYGGHRYGDAGDSEPDVNGRQGHDQGGEQGLHSGSPPRGSQNHHRPLPTDPHARVSASTMARPRPRSAKLSGEVTAGTPSGPSSTTSARTDAAVTVSRTSSVPPGRPLRECCTALTKSSFRAATASSAAG